MPNALARQQVALAAAPIRGVADHAAKHPAPTIADEWQPSADAARDPRQPCPHRGPDRRPRSGAPRMTDHATSAQAANDRPEIELDADGQTPNPRYVPLPDGSLFDIAESHGLTPGKRPRCDGWTADRQRRPVPPEHAHWTNFRRTFRAWRDDTGVNPVPPAPAKAGVSRGASAPLAVRTRAVARPRD